MVSYGGKTIPRWRTAAILKIVISPYLSEKLSNFDEIFIHRSRFWTGWTSNDQKWKSCIGHTLSSTERISCYTVKKLAKTTWPYEESHRGVPPHTVQFRTPFSWASFPLPIVCLYLELLKSYKVLKVFDKPKIDELSTILDHAFGGPWRYQHQKGRRHIWETALPSEFHDNLLLRYLSPDKKF